jgi:hypothetical protein
MEHYGSKGGRPKGTTLSSKRIFAWKKRNAVTEATKLYVAEKEKAEMEGKPMSKGVLTSIITTVEEQNELDTGTVLSTTIRNRAHRKNISGIANQRISPLANVEPILVEYCLRLSKIGAPLTKDQVITLASSLIHGTTHLDDLIEFKRRRHLLGEEVMNQNILGNRWYSNFLGRNSDKLKRGRGRVRDVKRHTWCNIDAFQNMYDNVYDTMVDAGVAELLPEPVTYDIYGVETTDPKLMYGCPTKYKMIHPEMILFADECGSNTNQATDGHVGGQLFVLPSDRCSTGILGMVTDIHFTVLCFTSGIGEPVMCAVILKSEKEACDIPDSWKFGIDLTMNINTGGTDYEFFENNSGEGQAMQGGPQCFFQDTIVPCFVGTSPKASITSNLLAEMLSFLDSFSLFDRSNGVKPFLLVDGHPSRFDLPFLNYIHDDKHPWVCCIGVPYGTHIWQVADSPQLNGAFKIELTKAKRRLFEIKVGLKKSNFEMSDIIPLVRTAWKGSFAIAKNAKTAIAERGWNPLNYALLHHPALVDKPSSNIPNQIRPVNMSTINTESGLASELMNKIVEEKSKEEARIETLRKRKNELDLMSSQVERLKTISRYSSGQLAGVGKFHICKNTHNAIKQNLQQGEIKRNLQESKRKQREEILIQKYRDARNKVRSGRSDLLTIDDLKSLLRQHRRKHDSPTCTKVKELKAQWNRRCHRMLLFDDNIIDDHCDAEPPARLERNFVGTSTLNADNVVGTSTCDNYDEGTTTRLDDDIIDDNETQNCTGTSGDLEISQRDLIQQSYFERYQSDESEIADVLCAIADSTGTNAST